MGLVIGAGFVTASFLGANARLRIYGIIYILLALVALGVREILREMRRAHRHRTDVSTDSGGARP